MRAWWGEGGRESMEGGEKEGIRAWWGGGEGGYESMVGERRRV